MQRVESTLPRAAHVSVGRALRGGGECAYCAAANRARAPPPSPPLPSPQVAVPRVSPVCEVGGGGRNFSCVRALACCSLAPGLECGAGVRMTTRPPPRKGTGDCTPRTTFMFRAMN